MKRRRRHEEHESHERWLVSYADFITLLFAFFVVMYATSHSDVDKQEDFEDSIRREFWGGGVGAGAGSGEGDSHANPFSKVNLFDQSPSEFPEKSASPAEARDYVLRVVESKMSAATQSSIANVKHDSTGVRIEMKAASLFASGSADLVPESLQALKEIGTLLKESGRKIIIEGHTDNQPIRTEKYPSNWELSAARATKMVRYLMSAHEISGKQLAAIAYADQRPVAPNDDPENRARNRRIEILIVTDE